MSTFRNIEEVNSQELIIVENKHRKENKKSNHFQSFEPRCLSDW